MHKRENGDTVADSTFAACCARTLWADVWANAIEEGHAAGLFDEIELSGQDLTQIAPETPAEAVELAERLEARIERESGLSIEQWAILFDLDEETFAHATALAVAGHGAGLYVDHDAEDKGFPRIQIECMAYIQGKRILFDPCGN